MASQKDLDSTYMGTAVLHSRLSKAIRKQVGAVVVTSQGVALTGFNGTPTGASNRCEDIDSETGEYVTRPDVVHAELNCILKAAREGVSVLQSTVYVTLAPCLSCSAMLVQAGIKRLVYAENYRDTRGIELLLSSGIIVDTFHKTQGK